MSGKTSSEQRIEKDPAISELNDQVEFADPPHLSAEDERKLWRKIDLRLLPILSIMYLLSYLDRGNIGNARLQGLESQLHLVGNQYNIALTMFFIPYCLFECPANLVLKRLRPSRWLPGIMIVWGVVMTLMGLVKTYPQLVGVRLCLGIAEAGLFPGVVYYLSIWYPRHKLQLRIAMFYGGASLAGAFSGLLAYGISFMSGTGGLLGWSWIFILEGIATVLMGFAAIFVLVDFPDTAKFLTDEERAFILEQKKRDNFGVGEEEHFEIRQLKAVLTDWQVWAHILVFMSIVAPIYGITLFLPSIINSFGYSTTISQLLTVPPYIVATIVVLVNAYYSDKLRLRSPFIFAGLILCLIGYCINISAAPHGVKYFGTFLIVTGGYGAFPGIVAWLGNNLSGHYKRGVGMALQIGIGNFSGAIAVNLYRTQDSPRYIFGHGLELMFVGIGLITLPIIVLNYVRINRGRDAVEKRGMEHGSNEKTLTAQQLREMGDLAPSFRYTL